MARPEWCMFFVVAMMAAAAAATAGRSPPNKSKEMRSSILTNSRSRESKGLHSTPPALSADALRVGKTRASRGAEAKTAARSLSTEEDPAKSSRSKKASREGVPKVTKELDAPEQGVVEGVPAAPVQKSGSDASTPDAGTSRLAPEGETSRLKLDIKENKFSATGGEEAQAPAFEGGKNGRTLEEQMENRFPPKAEQGKRFTPQAAQGGRFAPQLNKNRINPERNGNRFTPSPVKTEPRESGHFRSTRNRFPPGANRDTHLPEAGQNNFASVNGRYAIPETARNRFSPEAIDKDRFSAGRNRLAPEPRDRNRFSPETGERNRSAPETGERNRFGKNRIVPPENHLADQASGPDRFAPQAIRPTHPRQEETKHSLFPRELTNRAAVMLSQATRDTEQQDAVSSGAESDAAVDLGAPGETNATNSTEPAWLAWYNIHPWRQEILSEYAEASRPSRAAFGL